ncbi:ATP-dependent DNA helicase RecG [Schleiferiaceae bacterium]|jgi:ATP-dependent DNA helicase RecG|nr:ATP-dependent DNA helicase RecG [Bacteroidota bacterium]MCO4775681.1 ATP-dependent DNA helicase RecG [Flavobacteriales bacterium]MDA9286398.1 ATP-dependent DNA helicase RecG [Schleiferiaceae bacterium]MCO4790730.1 ATP-dependent DNA helicase RecG [Flavobacteriales bacterium]MDA9791252.1 ATP-dependent DNA helicase RecG [Schleiferiaceae bacterium]
MSTTQSPIVYAPGIGPDRAALLAEEFGIRTMAQFMEHYPFRYVDKSQFHTIRTLNAHSGDVQIKGQITKIEELGAPRQRRLVATFTDGEGFIELVWFKGAKWVRKSLKLNTPMVVYGKVNDFNGKKSLPHPELYAPTDAEESAVEPVYSTTEKLTKRGLNSKGIAKVMKAVLKAELAQVEEPFSEAFRTKNQLVSKVQALTWIHFPPSAKHLEAAKNRIKFEEFFFLQLTQQRNKLRQKTAIKGYTFEEVGAVFLSFYNHHLPFELTNAQKRVVKEIRGDVRTGAQMNRLVQGDVGSGKTIVALLAMLLAIDNGYQAALMAPTEILATQHYNGLRELCEPAGITVELLTGSTPAAKRAELHNALQEGRLQILIGTHALIEPTVKFANLGLAVIDEQHRFGVAQRAKLWKKNEHPPHVLVMTATPIPRTLAMSVYGDLDISVIDELPPGRKPVKTLHLFDKNRLKLNGFMQREIAAGRQVYVVFPLIEESEKLDLKNLEVGYEQLLRDFPRPQYQIAVVHGRMTAAEKEGEMQRFAKGKANIMVATTVIEVGVNVPNASVMVIENAERFGLSQLHQLRGRVGRGSDESYCILVSSFKLSADAKTRLETMVRTTDGFEIAEVDMQLRGPGDLMGTRQSGQLQFKLASLLNDGAILAWTKGVVEQLLLDDAQLNHPDHQGIKSRWIELYKDQWGWNRIS